jgi:sugar lactone lactonase YvrE
MDARRSVSIVCVAATAAAAGVLVHAGQQGQGQTPSPLPLSNSIRERGSSITPAYEGWYRNKDGSISLLVGYFNRNTKQALDVPVGPNNRIEPGGPDQGQPTHFLTSRQWGVFSIKVPADFASKKLTWTLVVNGQTNAVTLHTLPEWQLEPFEDPASKNTPPVVKLQADGPAFTGPPAGIAANLTATTASPLGLTVWATDEPPKLAVANALLVAPAAGRGRGAGAPPVALGWSVFRGPGPVAFENARPRVDPAADGKASTTATFSTSGDYILRLQANDSSGDGGGGFQCCWTNVLVGVSVKAGAGGQTASAQPASAIAPTPAPTNDAPNPYRTVENWAKLPEGRAWGSLSAVDIDRDGKSIWVADRCGGNSACLESPAVDPVFHFDASGRLIKSFGAGLLVSPHGIHVDRDGNIWVTDYQDNAPRPAGGARGRGGPVGAAAGATKGHQVVKFSPDGKVLMTLGDPGGAVDPRYFFQPNDVAVGRNGDIFVSQGHGQGKSELLKFSSDGKLIKRWGQTGTGPNEFDQPHALAFDSKGRLFVGDRNNNRIQILDQDGNFLEQWTQFSRPSGIYIDARDTIYVADSESESVSRNHPGWKRGIRIGRIADGKVLAFIPDPVETATGTSAAEGVAADAEGNVYGAEVGPRALKKYVKK